jgi:hypothetical protein
MAALTLFFGPFKWAIHLCPKKKDAIFSRSILFSFTSAALKEMSHQLHTQTAQAAEGPDNEECKRHTDYSKNNINSKFVGSADRATEDIFCFHHDYGARPIIRARRRLLDQFGPEIGQCRPGHIGAGRHGDGSQQQQDRIQILVILFIALNIFHSHDCLPFLFGGVKCAQAAR